MLLVRLAHFLGFIFLAASGFGAWAANRAAQAEKGDAAAALDRLQRTFARATSWGLAIVFLSGIGAIRVFRHDGPQMAKETWLLVMILTAFVAGGLAGAGGARTKKLVLSTDEAERTSLRDKLGTIHVMYLVAAFVALACGIFRFRL